MEKQPIIKILVIRAVREYYYLFGADDLKELSLGVF